jgi:ribosomal protein L29
MREDLKELSNKVLKELTPEVYPLGVEYHNIRYKKAIEELSNNK